MSTIDKSYANTPSVRTFNKITPTLGDNVFIDPAAVVIGDVHLGDNASVWPGAIIRGDMHRIRIGACTNVQDVSVVYFTYAN